MSKIKFYALCCRNMYALKRHEKTIPKEDLIVVINTLIDEFSTKAVEYCTNNNIEHYVTESDGSPSKGKNSVMDLFQQSEHDYMVLIDGDDFLTPHGTWTYKKLAESESCPDALSLQHQWGIYADKGWSYAIQTLNTQALKASGLNDLHAGNPTIGTTDWENVDEIHGIMVKPFHRKESWWRDAREGRIVREIEGDSHSVAFSDVYKEWATYVNKYISKHESHLRTVIFSKKMVETGIRHNLDHQIGEDTLLYLDIKRAHLNGDIVLKHLFDRYPTYIYDQRVAGVVWREKDRYGKPDTIDYGWYKWMRKLVDALKRYESEGILSEELDMPMINVKTLDMTWMPEEEVESTNWDITWPEDYRPDLMNLVCFPGRFSVDY